ncbi:MAG: ACT domain-containing protein [Phycisphaerae bacterium]
MFSPVIQFSVFLVSKPGILSRVCDALAEHKVNVVAMTLMDSVEHGVFRLVAANTEKARSLLKSLNLPIAETEVLAAEMSNRPGAMADLCARLNSAHIRIKYAYVTSGARGGRTTGIFKVDNTKRAIRLSNSKRPGRKEKKVVRNNRAIRGR